MKESGKLQERRLGIAVVSQSGPVVPTGCFLKKEEKKYSAAEGNPVPDSWMFPFGGFCKCFSPIFET